MIAVAGGAESSGSQPTKPRPTEALASERVAKPAPNGPRAEQPANGVSSWLEWRASSQVARSCAALHRHGSAAVLALIGILTTKEHSKRRTRSVTASSGGEDLPNNLYMRYRRELGESTMEVARPHTSAVPGAQTDEETTLRVEDKRGRRPSRRHRATKQLHGGSTMQQPVYGGAPIEQPRERVTAERTRLSLAPFAAAAGLAAIVALIATKVDWAEYLAAIALGVLAGLVRLIPVRGRTCQGKRDSAIADLPCGRRLSAQRRRRGELGDRGRCLASRVLDRPVR